MASAAVPHAPRCASRRLARGLDVHVDGASPAADMASGPLAMATRRRRSGAFAAELLLPHQALLDASDGALDGIVQDARFGDLLTGFGVGATTAAYQLWNGGLLSSPEIRDDLIASA